jgi:quercetin dioxygenase-like cupin family protein
MTNAMVCHITEGGLRVLQNGNEFRVQKGDVWTCAIGTTEQAWNKGNSTAIMRITDLLSA